MFVINWPLSCYSAKVKATWVWLLYNFHLVFDFVTVKVSKKGLTMIWLSQDIIPEEKFKKYENLLLFFGPCTDDMLILEKWHAADLKVNILSARHSRLKIFAWLQILKIVCLYNLNNLSFKSFAFRLGKKTV